MSRHLLLAALALGSATASAADITEINGVTLTNGLGTITDASALGSYNQAQAITALTDSSLSSGIMNMGSFLPGSALQGSFSGSISSSANSVFFVQPALDSVSPVPSGPIDLQLVLVGGSLTSAKTYGKPSYTVTSQSFPVGQAYFVSATGSAIYQTEQAFANIGLTNTALYAYLQVPFSDFGVSNGQVIGVKLTNISSNYPDFTYIGLGYAGSPVVPEASTYGLAIGGLALAAVALRRRSKVSK